MRKEERYKGVLNWFNEHVPVAETELHYDNPYQLLIAVILSAQCTDKRVNMITPALFRDFPTPEVMAASTSEVIFEYIRSVSYPNNKSKHLVGMAKMLMSDFDGVVPSDIDELQKLPGRRPQDGKRHSLGRLQQASNGCRHTCVPRSQPHRPDKQQQNPVGNGKGVGEAYPGGTNPDRPPLVDPARTLHLYRPQAQMRRMWSQTLV